MTVAPMKWRLVVPSGSVHGIYDSREDAEEALRELKKDIPPGTPMAGAFMIVGWRGLGASK